MVHIRTSHRKTSSSRARSSTPSRSKSMIKQAAGPNPQSKRQRQKQEHFKRQRRQAAFAIQRAQRERWASISRDTQGIVLGDGKYVEETSHRSVSSSALDSAAFRALCTASSSSTVHPLDAFKSLTPCTQESLIKSLHSVHDISPQIILSKQGTTFYPHFSPTLAKWHRPESSNEHPVSTKITFMPTTTLAAARRMHEDHSDLSTDPSRSLPTTSIGLLAFASPKRPGGGFLHGGNEQEEGLARSTSLVANLQTDSAKDFYKTHRKFLSLDGAGLHDHSMVYSPGVVVIRTDDDDGDNSGYPSASSNPASNFIAPYVVNVLSSVPVNAAAIRQNYLITPSDAHVFEDGIRNTMRDRMARALRIFEVRGNKAIVLGAFGCGSSENRIEMVAELWAELLVCEERSAEGDDPTIGINSVKQPAKFKDVFEEVVFAVPGKLHEPFKKAFEMRVFEAVVSGAAN